FDDFKLDQMEVNRMRVLGCVVNLPDLGCSRGRVFGDGLHPQQRVAVAGCRQRAERGVRRTKRFGVRIITSQLDVCRLVLFVTRPGCPSTKTVSDSASLMDTWRMSAAGGNGSRRGRHK